MGDEATSERVNEVTRQRVGASELVNSLAY